jgi:hypothetical protein
MRVNKKTQTPVDHADAYRGYSRALRILSPLHPEGKEGLTLQAHIATYLYEEGHVHWLALCKLDCADFGRAFDMSRAKAGA